MPAVACFPLECGNPKKLDCINEGHMPGGRPSQGKQQRYPELEELATWFHQALGDAGFGSVHEFLSTGLFEKNAVYGVFNATRLLTLESTQSLAVALKRNPAQVVDVWMRAKEARDRETLAAQRVEQPRLSSWAHLPLPSLALRNLLEAQSTTVERLPYTLLGVDEPPLSTVYVRQQVRVRATTDRDMEVGGTGAQREVPVEQQPTAVGPQPVLSVSEALERHDHLLVTGEPGAGKSTLSNILARTLSLIWLREESATDAPLTEPVAPLRVSARSLDGSGSWCNVLAEAVSRGLGRSLLQDPDAGMFAGRVQGVRWLILVDGLDEIPDSRVRGEIIRTLAQHARSGSDYRFVVTSRILPESELSPLRIGNVGNYVIQPFGRAELEQFARQWFTAQGVESAAKETERFIRETSDGRLRELVRNPLLATIAAVSAVKEPDRPLPASRISLYERFCGYLSGDRSGNRNTVAQLRHHHHDDPERIGCVLWLHSHRLQIVSVLARRRLESQEALWPVAQEWVREQVGEDIKLIDGWEDHLWEELIGAGLLVAAGRELRFLHQSFAEFLSAQSHANIIGEDFADLEVWIRRGLKEAERTFALFTFSLWASKPGHDISLIVERLLSSYDSRRVLLAGRLMAEGIVIGHDIADRIVDRLVALARNAEEFSQAIEAVDVLGALYDYPWVADRIEALASLSVLPVARRMAAVAALEHLTGSERVGELLGKILPSSYGQTLLRVASMGRRLGPPVVDEIRKRVLDMVVEPDADARDRASATEVLRDLGLEADVETMARSVFAHPTATPTDLKRAADAWLDAQGQPAVSKVATLAVDRPEHDHSTKVRLAEFLQQAGDTDTAAVLATVVLTEDNVPPDAILDAVDVLLGVRGSDGVDLVMNVLERWSIPHSSVEVWHIAQLLKRVANVSPQTSVVERIKFHLAECARAIGAHWFVEAWLGVEGPSSAQSIMERVNQGASLHLYDRASSAKHLFEAGAQAEAQCLAESVLRTRHIGIRSQYREAAEVLLKIDAVTGSATLSELAHGRAHPHSHWFAGALDALTEHDGPEAAQLLQHIAAELTVLQQVEGEELRDALLARLIHEGAEYARTVATAALERTELSFDERKELARALAACGELDLAKTVWAGLLSLQEYSLDDDITLMDDLLCAGVGEWAAGQVCTLIDSPTTAPLRRMRLRQMSAWLRASEES
ncbi:MAG TPA: hypothetical protein VFV67_31445 [Actinophytocola sp.]|uniref:NACHT domain-containing protein n=1 Tax=Actinophytocola sp. TaxID=1872138 RepID=UPI002DBD6979|nr:hypothetical protein [Actinophytocola sp.]HEU5475182.1 hypothetical protein [Actinophytocola sp.]